MTQQSVQGCIHSVFEKAVPGGKRLTNSDVDWRGVIRWRAATFKIAKPMHSDAQTRKTLTPPATGTLHPDSHLILNVLELEWTSDDSERCNGAETCRLAWAIGAQN
jgi:hypothetical protein